MRVRGGPHEGAVGMVVCVVRITEALHPHDEALVSFAGDSADYFNVAQLEAVDKSGGEMKEKGSKQ